MKNMDNRFVTLFMIGMLCVPIYFMSAASDNHERLTREQRLALIATQLESADKADDLDLNLLAAWIKVDDAEFIISFIDKAKKLAGLDSLAMSHFEKVFYELNAGSQRGFFDCWRLASCLTDNQQESALHEAGHLVASAYHPKMVALCGTIIQRSGAEGIYQNCDISENRSDWTIEDVKRAVVVNLAGPVTEQVFNIHPIGMLNRIWDRYIHHLDYADVELSFEELVNRKAAEDDLRGARQLILALVAHSCQAQGLDCSPENLQNEDVQEQYNIIYNQLVKELHQQVVEFVQIHKPEIQKLANLLEENGYVSTREIYEVCNKKRPLLDIERN